MIGQTNQPASNDDASSLIRVSRWPWSTTLRNDILATDTEIPAEATAGASSPDGVFRLRNELVVYTGTTADTFTGCLRGQFLADGGGRARDHPGGTPIVQLHGPAHHRVLADAAIAAQTRISALEAAAMKLRYAMGAPQAGDTVANTSGSTAFASAAPLPANDLTAQRVYRLIAAGVYSVGTGSPSLTLRVRIVSGIPFNLLQDTVVFSATARTNRPWRLEATITVVTTGATGTIEAHGEGRLFTATQTDVELELFNTAALTVDTTVAQTLGVSAAWSAAAVANSITLRQFVVYSS